MGNSFLKYLELPLDRDPTREELIAHMRKHHISPRWNPNTGFYLQYGNEKGSWVIGRTKERFRKILGVNTRDDADKLCEELFGQKNLRDQTKQNMQSG